MPHDSTSVLATRVKALTDQQQLQNARVNLQREAGEWVSEDGRKNLLLWRRRLLGGRGIPSNGTLSAGGSFKEDGGT